jgi:nucleotide-binding universal stress UspA family protein
METPKLILVPTDFSSHAAHALRYASSLAERFGSHLFVIYADTFIPPVDFTATAAGEFSLSRESMIEDTGEELIRFAEENIGRSVLYDTRVVVDSPMRAILAQATEAGCDLIVMGTHGRTGVRRLVVGSVTEAIMRASSVPVLAVNQLARETGAVARVLCPVSYTNACRDALKAAATLTDDRKAPLILLRTVECGDARETVDELQKLREWIPADLVDRCEIKIVPAHATAEQILAMANATSADLIALGAEPGGNIAEILRGSVADRVVQQSGCPVLTANSANSEASQCRLELQVKSSRSPAT